MPFSVEQLIWIVVIIVLVVLAIYGFRYWNAR